MKPNELIHLLTSMSAAADVVEAIDHPVLQTHWGWNLRNWRYDCIPWGVRFRYREGHEKANIAAVASVVREPACSKPHLADLGTTTVLMLA